MLHYLVIFTVLLYRFQNTNGLIIFFSSAIIGGLFEYICSLVQEKIIGTISWEYSHTPLNIHGRTSGLYCFYWGILGLIFLRHTLPYCSNLIEKIPNNIGIFFSWFFVIFMILDLLISALAVKRKTNRHHNIPCKNSFDKFLDKHYPDEFLNKIYPNMKVVPKNK